MSHKKRRRPSAAPELDSAEALRPYSKDSRLDIRLRVDLHNIAAEKALGMDMTLSDVVRRFIAAFAQMDFTKQRIVILDTRDNSITSITGLA